MRRTRAVSLTYDPEGAPELKQRSRIIAPLIAQKELLGYLYADIDGAFGRFHDADRDLLGMLASQAAVALDNAQWSQGLEQKVAQRTEELQASNALLEQRASELAIINSVQQGLAAQLDFQAIVDLVGDKLREIFGTADMSIALHDRADQPGALCRTTSSTASAFRWSRCRSGIGLTGHVMRDAASLWSSTRISGSAPRSLARSPSVTPRHRHGAISYLGVPILKRRRGARRHRAREPRARTRVRRIRGAPADARSPAA